MAIKKSGGTKTARGKSISLKIRQHMGLPQSRQLALMREH